MNNNTISTGIPQLDLITGGFMPPELVILASRPSSGKTSLALAMVRHIAIENNFPVGFLSLEMETSNLKQRLLAQEAMIPLAALRENEISESNVVKLNEKQERLSNAPIYINDDCQIAKTDMYSWIKRMVSENAVKIIFIDYLGLIRNEDNSITIHEHKTAILVELKNMAQELGIAIIALDQINRDLNNSHAQRQLEIKAEQADTVLLLDGALEEHSFKSCKRLLHIIKHRDKPQSKIIELPFRVEIPAFSR